MATREPTIATPEPTMATAEPTSTTLEPTFASLTDGWHYLDHGSGTAVRCAAQCGYMECAASDETNCQWGGFPGFAPYEPIPNSAVVSTHAPLVSPCPGWVPTDASDACQQLDCYCAGPVIEDFDDTDALSRWQSQNLGAGEENWTVEGGVLRESANIHGGTYCQLGNTGAALTHKVATTGSDFTMMADIRNTDDDALGFVWCFEDSNNYWLFRVAEQAGCKQVHKVVDGVWTDVVTVDGTNFACARGQYCSYSVVASAEGGTTIYKNSEVFLQTSESCSGGKAGFYSWGNSGGYFDNFRLESGTFHPTTTTEEPTQNPTFSPTEIPSEVPTYDPTFAPTDIPTDVPTTAPTEVPSHAPSDIPSGAPTTAPSEVPTHQPSVTPTDIPSNSPTTAPTEVPSHAPSDIPSGAPTTAPSEVPTHQPSVTPTDIPSVSPSVAPSTSPSCSPTVSPSDEPTVTPSYNPSVLPSVSPSFSPSVGPSKRPSLSPSSAPTMCNPICQHDFDMTMTDMHLVLEREEMKRQELNSHYELLRATVYHLCAHVALLEPNFIDCTTLLDSLPTTL